MISKDYIVKVHSGAEMKDHKEQPLFEQNFSAVWQHKIKNVCGKDDFKAFLKHFTFILKLAAQNTSRIFRTIRDESKLAFLWSFVKH